MEIQPNNPKDELIEKICKRNLRLSYSTLKNFTSPVNLIRYKLKPYKKNPSMIFGLLCDVLILTPENFNKDFAIIDKVPESDNQVGLSNALIEISKEGIELTPEIIQVQFDMFYKRGDCMKTFGIIEDYVRNKSLGKELITQSTYDEAREVCDNLLENEDIQILFSQIIEVQKKVKWGDNGWEFLGFYDMYLEDHIIDLKFSKDANPEKFERDIANFDYFLQAAMYCIAARKMGLSENPKYSFIVYDKSFNYSIIELDYSYLAYGERKYNYLLQELDRCIDENAFNESYGFFKRSYKAYKPKWAKGYALKTDPVE